MDIKFIYSKQYNDVLGKKTGPAFFRWLEETEKEWDQIGKRVMNAIEEITQLKFPEGEKICYVNRKASFSDPLTLRLTRKIDDNIDNLTHELIHVILTENYPKIKESWDSFIKSLDEPMLVKSHIVVHTIHLFVAKKLGLPSNRVERIISYSRHPAYRKSWKMAGEIGFFNVLARAVHLSTV